MARWQGRSVAQRVPVGSRERRTWCQHCSSHTPGVEGCESTRQADKHGVLIDIWFPCMALTCCGFCTSRGVQQGARRGGKFNWTEELNPAVWCAGGDDPGTAGLEASSGEPGTPLHIRSSAVPSQPAAQYFCSLPDFSRQSDKVRLPSTCCTPTCTFHSKMQWESLSREWRLQQIRCSSSHLPGSCNQKAVAFCKRNFAKNTSKESSFRKFKSKYPYATLGKIPEKVLNRIYLWKYWENYCQTLSMGHG